LKIKKGGVYVFSFSLNYENWEWLYLEKGFTTNDFK